MILLFKQSYKLQTGRRAILLDGMQPDPKRKRYKQRPNQINSIATFSEFQKNFINEFSLLYFEKNDLQNQLKEKDEILEEQRKIIQKLTTKKGVIDIAVQTQSDLTSQFTQTETNTVEISVQTEDVEFQCEPMSEIDNSRMIEPMYTGIFRARCYKIVDKIHIYYVLNFHRFKQKFSSW